LDELIISGLGYSPRREKRIHKNDIEALALEVYDEDSFLSLTLWKKGSIVWRIPLTSFIHPRHMVTIYEDIKDFLHQHDFEFEARSSIPHKEGWPALTPEELAAQTHSKTRRIVRDITGVFVGVIIISISLILLIMGLGEIRIAETEPVSFFVLVIICTSQVYFVGGYVTAKITREEKSYDGLVVGIVSLCLFIVLFLAATRDFETSEYIPALWKALIKVLILICMLLFVFCSFLGARVQKKGSTRKRGKIYGESGTGINK
jgi:multisubunit Na+/H+ antiporter MnhB subunit